MRKGNKKSQVCICINGDKTWRSVALKVDQMDWTSEEGMVLNKNESYGKVK